MTRLIAYVLMAAAAASIAWAAAGMLSQLSDRFEKTIDRSTLVDVAR